MNCVAAIGLGDPSNKNRFCRMMLTPNAVSSPVVRSAPRTVRNATRSRRTDAATQAMRTVIIRIQGLPVINVVTMTIE